MFQRSVELVAEVGVPITHEVEEKCNELASRIVFRRDAGHACEGARTRRVWDSLEEQRLHAFAVRARSGGRPRSLDARQSTPSSTSNIAWRANRKLPFVCSANSVVAIAFQAASNSTHKLSNSTLAAAPHGVDRRKLRGCTDGGALSLCAICRRPGGIVRDAWGSSTAGAERASVVIAKFARREKRRLMHLSIYTRYSH